MNDTTKHWLVKTEPEAFSIGDLVRAKNKTTSWTGVRNYQARNYMRDEMQLGDPVLFYHSNAEPSAIVGLARVVKESQPDPTSWDEHDSHYDPKSTPLNPRWFMVDLQWEETFARPLTLAMLREIPALAHMELLRKGSRLSVMPVSKGEFAAVLKFAAKLAGSK
jgi:predicted RNA-binding protein with PUA-like domain